MDKKIFKVVLLILVIGLSRSVNAANGTLGISANVSTIKVGQSVTVSIYANGLTGSFNVTSSNSSVLSGGCTNVWYENNTYTCTFSAVGEGTASVTVSSIAVNHNDDYSDFSGSKSTSVSVVNPSNNSGGGGNNSSSGGGSTNSGGGNSSSGGSTSDKKTYSSDNSLSSLSVDGYEIDFDKDTIEYKLEVDESVDKINVSAKTTDDKASVSGTGEINLSSGENTIEVKVTAENGNEKKYKIIVNVIDKNPIEVTIGKDKYTIVKKNNDLIGKLEKFEEGITKINDQDVISYTNKTSKLTLVILKDKDGKYAYYVYNSKKNTYTLYRQIDINNISLFYNDMPKNSIPLGSKKYSFTYNNEKFIGYKYSKDSDFYMFYAMNIDTGKYSIYVYDTKENTIQRYNKNGEKYLTASLNSVLNRYKIISIISIGVIVIVGLVVSILQIKKRKMKKKRINI